MTASDSTSSASRGKLVITGGSGYIGHLLAEHFARRFYTVVILSRQALETLPHARTVRWDGENLGAWAKELEGAAAIINMAGRSVNCRYNEKNKQEIYDSRLHSTRVIGDAIGNCQNPPPLWINSSSATIYRHALDRAMDDATGEIGSGFSVDVCRRWEKMLFDAVTPDTRKIALRSAIVISKEGEAMEAFLKLTKFGLGGKLGPGTQFMSWIHGNDFTRIIEFLMEHQELDGVINCAAPDPIPNARFMSVLRRLCHRPIGLPATVWMLKIGAWLLGTETELLLKSRRVVPRRLVDAGFQFKYPDIESALREIVGTE